MMSRKRAVSICSAVLMLLLTILQFNPFWHYGEPEESVSIQDFIWFPTKHTALESYIREETGDQEFSVGSIVTMPVLELLFCAAGIVLCCFKGESPAVPLFPLGAGVTGIIGYPTVGAFRLGGNWGLHLAVCIVLAALGAFGFYFAWKDRGVHAQLSAGAPAGREAREV